VIRIKKASPAPAPEPKGKKDDGDKPAKGKDSTSSLTEKLLKKGAKGMKQTAERWMQYDAATQKVKYAKKEGDLKASNKSVKEIDCNGAEITTSEKGKVFWVIIKKGKFSREIGAKTKEQRDKWRDALKGGEKKGDEPKKR